MASLFADYILDNGIGKINTEATKIFINSSDPTTYTEASSTFALGNMTWTAGSAFAAPTASTPNGREVNSTPITAGSVTASSSATKWSVVDHTNSRLHANGALSAPTSVVSGTTFQLASFKLRFPSQ